MTLCRAALAAILAWAVPSAAGEHATPPDAEAILAELNRMRADPGRYGDAIDERARWFVDARVYRPPGDPVGMLTLEGPAAVREAAEALRRVAPMPPLSPSPRLSAAALQLAREQAASGAIGHRDRMGRGPGERVRALGGDVFVAEVISYGHVSARDVVMALLIDDGVGRRGHRVTLLDRQNRFAGAGCATHSRYRVVCVIDLSSGRDGHYVPPDL
ncbi:CAP domain-containing protein [Sphingomonas sp. FW199]|uniref:CAP domain-containing protein n=1 Tax=Sphingomonas sp. FW199 TaxID=3400217 RepID=UPI003CF0A45F